jgi:hypothetical protein
LRNYEERKGNGNESKSLNVYHYKTNNKRIFILIWECELRRTDNNNSYDCRSEFIYDWTEEKESKWCNYVIMWIEM